MLTQLQAIALLPQPAGGARPSWNDPVQIKQLLTSVQPCWCRWCRIAEEARLAVEPPATCLPASASADALARACRWNRVPDYINPPGQ
ncbi:hypothetical protein MJ561_04245 [Klebsiella pneumoniae]|nr:hypothetical protein MJ561_04245 [Klebsiella pneumoniae]